jgi:hypothetical protein
VLRDEVMSKIDTKNGINFFDEPNRPYLEFLKHQFEFAEWKKLNSKEKVQQIMRMGMEKKMKE